MGTEALRRPLIAVLLVALSLPAFHMGSLPTHAMLISNAPRVAQGQTALQRIDDLHKVQAVHQTSGGKSDGDIRVNRDQLSVANAQWRLLSARKR
jgi:hypothetical protein